MWKKTIMKKDVFGFFRIVFLINSKYNKKKLEFLKGDIHDGLSLL